MNKTHVFSLPAFSKPVIVEVDACATGVGAVLMQERKPITFLSQALSTKHQGLSTYEKELVSLLQAIDRWRHYLVTRHVIIMMDHFRLKFLHEKKINNAL